MWAWKAGSMEGGIQPAIWGAVVNKEPVRKIDFHNASAKEIEAYFRKFAKEPLVVYEKLRKHLSGKGGPLTTLPKPPPARTKAPQMELAGWTQAEIGGGLPGGLEVLGSERFALFGAGSDVWATQDQARFLYQEVEGDFELEVTVESVEDIHQYTKAGLMVRVALTPDSPTAILTSFNDGGVQLAFRGAPGKEMEALPMDNGSIPRLKLRLVRSGGRFSGFFTNEKDEVKSLGTIADKLPRKVYAGVMALSHDNSQLAKIVYRDLRLRKN